MEFTALFEMVFYTAKILRIGTITGIFRGLQDSAVRLVSRPQDATLPPTRLQKAGR
jgi:hypothetical protein